MVFKIEFQTEAIEDIQNAFEWYEEQKSGLGFSFLEEFEICINKLSKSPFRYGLVNKWVRKIQINRFPYLIVFEIEEDKVYVNAVRHTSRKPKYKSNS